MPGFYFLLFFCFRISFRCPESVTLCCDITSLMPDRCATAWGNKRYWTCLMHLVMSKEEFCGCEWKMDSTTLPERACTLRRIIIVKGHFLGKTVACHSCVFASKGTSVRARRRCEVHGMTAGKAKCGCVYLIGSLWLGMNKRPRFLPHNAPRRLFLVPRPWGGMKGRPQRKECGSCCGLGGSEASGRGGRVSVFWHWVAPGVRNSGSAAGGWVKAGGKKNGC